jgi:hypothetical protein
LFVFVALFCPWIDAALLKLASLIVQVSISSSIQINAAHAAQYKIGFLWFAAPVESSSGKHAHSDLNLGSANTDTSFNW